MCIVPAMGYDMGQNNIPGQKVGSRFEPLPAIFYQRPLPICRMYDMTLHVPCYTPAFLVNGCCEAIALNTRARRPSISYAIAKAHCLMSRLRGWPPSLWVQAISTAHTIRVAGTTGCIVRAGKRGAVGHAEWSGERSTLTRYQRLAL